MGRIESSSPCFPAFAMSLPKLLTTPSLVFTALVLKDVLDYDNDAPLLPFVIPAGLCGYPIVVPAVADTH